MRRIFCIIWIVLLIGTMRLYAQKVYKSENNKVILDLTKEAGMPEGAITSHKKYVDIVGDAADNKVLLDAENFILGKVNKTVFQKLEIAPYDLNASGELDTKNAELNWVDAFNSCKKLTYDGGGWRLPTQRELQLIYIFKPALDNILVGMGSSASKLSSYYWSATEVVNKDGGSTLAYAMIFSSGYSPASYSKTTSNSVRCVREVED